MVDRVTVKEIMDSCTGTLGKSQKNANQDLQKFTEEKNRTDEAMDRLKKLYDEYCDQIFREQKPVNLEEAKN